MRKEAKAERTMRQATIAHYHCGNHAANKLFTSDRYIPLDDNYMRENGIPYKGFGLEIETECFISGIPTAALADIIENRIYPLFPKDLFKMERDGSLADGTSAEIITQVMTKEFIRNHYKDWKAMFKIFSIYKISASQSGRCGMHINISKQCFGSAEKTQDIAIRKLYYIINHYYHLSCSLLRRNPMRTRYCGQMRDDKAYCKTVNMHGRYSDHGVSFNFGHYDEGQGRIELRLTGGQENFGAFRNTMETVFFLIDRVKEISWEDIDDMAKLFSGCNKYVFDRLTLAVRENVLGADVVEAIRPTVAQVDYL